MNVIVFSLGVNILSTKSLSLCQRVTLATGLREDPVQMINTTHKRQRQCISFSKEAASAANERNLR